MPVIEEENLTNLYKEIEFQKNKINYLIEDAEEITEHNEELGKHRLVLGILTGVLFLLLLLVLGVFFFSPNIFINKSKLEAQGYKIVTEEEYTQTQEYVANKVNAANLEKQQETPKDFFDAEIDESETNENQESINNTIIYAVQIKAFENSGLELYSKNLIQFAEIYKDDFYKYSLGAFETLEEAQDFRKELVKLGFEDAFVASYKNGRRLRIEEPY